MSVEIQIVHGDTARYLITITDDDLNRVDLTPGDLVVTAKERVSDQPVFVKSPGDGVSYLTQSGATLGQAELTIDDVDLADVSNDWQSLLFDVRFERDDVGPATPIQGQIRVLPSIGSALES